MMNKKDLYSLISEEVKNTLQEFQSSASPVPTPFVSPFDNEVANQAMRTDYQNLYEQLSDAVVMEMLSAYSVEQIREITRHFANQASQGPAGIGGRFSDAELEEIMELVFDKVQDAFAINLRSNMPEDRLHPNYMS